MDEDSFWSLIADCRSESGNDTELTSRLLFRHLRALGAADVVAFVERWERARSTLYTWPIADAACLLLSPVNEDDLRHIQDWIISHGHDVVDRVARDPDQLVDLAADAWNARAAWFDEFTTEAHVIVTGAWPMGYDPDGPEELTGEHVDLGDEVAVSRRFPRLAAFRREHPELGVPELR